MRPILHITMHIIHVDIILMVFYRCVFWRMDVDIKPLLQWKITVVVLPNLHYFKKSDNSKYLQPYLITGLLFLYLHTRFLSNICNICFSFYFCLKITRARLLSSNAWSDLHSMKWRVAGKTFGAVSCINTCEVMHLILLRHQDSPLVCFKVGEKLSGAAKAMQPNSTSN